MQYRKNDGRSRIALSGARAAAVDDHLTSGCHAGVERRRAGIHGPMSRRSPSDSRKVTPDGWRADQNGSVPKIDNGLAKRLMLLLTLVLAAGLLCVPESSAGVTRAAATRGWLPVIPGPPTEEPVPAADGGGRCADPTGTWLGMRWRTELRWRVNERTIPAYLGDRTAVVNALRAAATTVDTGRNDCGLPENLGIQESYAGKTDHRAGVTRDGGCGDRDGHNAVSFGPLNQGLLAVTCIWWFGGKDNGRSVETDILIDDTDGLFFTATPADCHARWDLEGTVTHEFGHAFGLGHVPFAEHGALTMTDGLPDCSTAYRGLGLGDYLTLKQQYGIN